MEYANARQAKAAALIGIVLLATLLVADSVGGPVRAKLPSYQAQIMATFHAQ